MTTARIILRITWPWFILGLSIGAAIDLVSRALTR